MANLMAHLSPYYAYLFNFGIYSACRFSKKP